MTLPQSSSSCSTFYEDVHQALLHDLTSLYPGVSVSDTCFGGLTTLQAACVALRKSFYKKLLPSGQSDECDLKALEKFSRVNERISKHSIAGPHSEVDSWLIDMTFDNLNKAVDKGLGQCSGSLQGFLVDSLNIGPGASLGTLSDNFFTKLFSGDLTYTDPYLMMLYRAACSRSVWWSDAERHRASIYGEDQRVGNRLFFVPKNSEISRTCCTEPLLNMLVQKAIGAFLLNCLHGSFGINLKVQAEYNRELALQGSLDGSFATIDLASASDSISWDMCERKICSPLIGMLRIARSPETILPDGSSVKLGMISTMGNGFTFPLQTLLFASVVRAVYQLKGYPSNCSRTQFSVFGDDIIVRTDCYPAVVRTLELLGFEVNADKSFSNGPFRESCGVDAYNGVDVRGVYVTTLETPHSRYSAYNRLARWSARHGLLFETLILLRKSCDQLLVPFSDSDSSGFKVSHAEASLSLRRKGLYGHYAYRRIAPKSPRIPVPENARESRDFTPGWDFNPSGWVVTYLAGHSGSPPDLPGIGLRHYIGVRPCSQEVMWFPQKATIPFWDFCGPVPHKDFYSWKTVVDLVGSYLQA